MHIKVNKLVVIFHASYGVILFYQRREVFRVHGYLSALLRCLVSVWSIHFVCFFSVLIWRTFGNYEWKGFYHRLTALFCFTYFRNGCFLVKFVLVGLTLRDKGVVIAHSRLKRFFPPLWALWLAQISSTVRLRKHRGGFANKLVYKKNRSVTS